MKSPILQLNKLQQKFLTIFGPMLLAPLFTYLLIFKRMRLIQLGHPRELRFDFNSQRIQHSFVNLHTLLSIEKCTYLTDYVRRFVRDMNISQHGHLSAFSRITDCPIFLSFGKLGPLYRLNSLVAETASLEDSL